MEGQYIWFMLLYDDADNIRWEPVLAFKNREDAIETARSFNKKHATPELVDENYDFCDEGDYEWKGNEIVYDVMGLRVLDHAKSAE